jgi:hypothetical protein
MGGNGLIAEAQLLVFMWCRIVDNGAHHACWLLLQALFMTASVLRAQLRQGQWLKGSSWGDLATRPNPVEFSSSKMNRP